MRILLFGFTALINLLVLACSGSDVRPKVKKTYAYCEAERSEKIDYYHDDTSLFGYPTGAVFPTKVPYYCSRCCGLCSIANAVCSQTAEGHPYTIEFGLSEYTVRWRGLVVC